MLFIGRRTPAKKPQPSSLTEAMVLETEAALMANMDFLTNTDVDMEDDDDMSDDVDLDPNDDMDDDVKAVKRKSGNTVRKYDDVDAEAMEVLNELNLLSESEDQRQAIKCESGDWNKCMYIFLLFDFLIISIFSSLNNNTKRNIITFTLRFV